MASWVGGLGPALLATLIGLLVASYLFVPPRGTFGASGQELFGMVTYVGTSLAIVAFGEAMRNAMRRARDAEEAARARTELRLPFDVAGVGHVEFDAASGRFLRASRAFCAMTGYTADELIGRPVQDITHPDDRERNRAALATLARGDQQRFELEKRYVRKDGRPFWARVSGMAVHDGGGALRFVGSVVDIGERKAAEEALRASEERFRTLADGMPHIVWECDRDGSCGYMNRAWEDYTGAAPGSSLGRAWLDHYDPRDADTLLAAWKAALDSGGDVPFHVYARIRRADGEYRWFRVNGAPVRGPSGEIVRWAGTCTDVHDVRELIAALQKADQRKDEFLATLAHELRNPLAPIRNAVEFLKFKGSPDASVVAAREMIERQLAQMVRLIDDLLDVSRITRGKLQLRRACVQLADVVRHALETSRPNVEAAGHRLDVALPTQPLHLAADLVRLAQVVANLLNNAAKYTPHGGRIALEARQDGSEVVISVRDDGIGIAPDMLDKVFEMFAQLDAAPGAMPGGLGIGLTLVKRLVEMHGGTVEARSEGRGHGSEFIVRIPVATSTDDGALPPAPLAAGAPQNGRRVLVVDDNRDAAVSLGMVLQLAGCETALAHDGVEALELAGRFRPDAVLLDLGLPRMDGHAVCRAIRAEPWGQGVAIVAITGWGQDEERRRSRDAGFDGHLVKPVDTDVLLRAIDAATQGRPRSALA